LRVLIDLSHQRSEVRDRLLFVEPFALESGRVDEVVDDRQRPIDRVGLLVDTHQKIRKARLDLSLAVATTVVFHEEGVRERRELSCLRRAAACRLDARDRRRSVLAPETTEESPALLLLRGRVRGRLLLR